MNIFKKSLAMFLVLCMMIGVVPMTAFATDVGSTEPTVTETTEETTEATEETTEAAEETTEDPYGIALANYEPASVSLSYADTYRILHLDCGRKYFTADWIKALINEMSAAGFTHLELAFGNDGLRFLLDDMSVGTYTDDQVTAAIQQGNADYNNERPTYSYNPSINELTQAEMDAIIDHANSKGIKIIPLLNNPGHMNAIVSAASSLTGSSAGYNGSSSTVDLENTEAVAFVKGLVEKYIAYFDGKGCNEFNFGADEYANDVYSTGSMGFGALTNAGKYQLFVEYVNEMASLIKGYGMVPIAFNDGIYFNMDTSYNFDKQIMVAFWTSGWSGYQSASASIMASLGHKMINVNGDYYYVLGKSDQWDSNGYTYASNWSNSAFMGSTVSNPAGSMFCIWCDYPGAETETQIAANTRLILRAMAAEMQGNDANSIDTAEIIPGGFNADGTIAEDCNDVTVKDEASGIEVTGCDLTSVTVAEAGAPEIEGAANVKAWDITPYVGTEKHTTSATVKLPVPEDWDTNRLGAFLVEADGTVTLIEGNYADDYYTFKMEHFSVGGIYEAAPAAEGDTIVTDNRTINLILGETKTDAIQGGDYSGTYTTNPEGVASVTAEYEQVEGATGPVQVTEISVGSAYYLSDGNGKYLNANAQWTTDINAAAQWTVIHDGNDYYLATGDVELWYDKNDGWSTYSYGDPFEFSNGAFVHYELKDAKLIPFIISGTAPVNQTTVTFVGTVVDSATVDVGPVRYTVNVTYAEKTINIVKQGTRTEEQSVTVSDYMDVASMDNDYVTATWSGNTVTFTAKDQTGTVEMIIGNTKYTVNVIEVNLEEVAPLTIEYWQTNARAEEQRGNGVTSKSVTVASAYSEEGIVLTSIIPVNTYKVGSAASDPALGYWRTRLLLRSTNEQTTDNGDDESLNGTGITKVRYWNGSWAVYTDAGEWQDITPANYQLAAYYMNDMHLADEVKVSTSDWGKKGNGEFSGTYLSSNNVSLAFQIVYEGGTTTPAGTGVELAPYTYFVDAWGDRGVGAVAINQIGDYQIWKITAETGEHSVTHNGDYAAITVNGFTWDNNEMTVWEDEKNPVSQYTIINPSSNPNTNGYYDNLRWNETNESILIRIYVKAVETEDSLKVVYYDEKFNVTLEEFNISVPNGSDFNHSIVDVNTKQTASLPEFAGNAERKNATGYGIVNIEDKIQKFETTLANVAVTNNRYNTDLYTYTGSVISEDGKTITHYYTINTKTLSPNFVADFGLPLTFPLSMLLGENQDSLVDSVTVKSNTNYGTLDYNPDTKMFTYTPTSILRSIDVLSINIKFDGADTATLTNVGVTPATTVYYGEQFLNFSNGWTTEGSYASVGEQAAEVLGESTYYGFDNAYARSDGASDGSAKKSVSIGDTATFTFTGTGIQVFANSAEGFGYVSVMVKKVDTGAYANVSMVDTDLKGTAGTETTGGQSGKNLTGLPVVSLVDLTGLPHGTYEVTITKVMDSDPVYIDGIRVFGTVDESKYDAKGTTDGDNPNPFLADEEDAPDFYEVRDLVMKAIGIQASDSTDYKTMFNQIYADTVEVGTSAVITSVNDPYGTTNRQDLLDNGPKNELYLFEGDKLTFNVSTDRVVQLGLKAPEGSAKYKLKVTETVDNTTEVLNDVTIELSTSVDMFYKIAPKASDTNKGKGRVLTVTVENFSDDNAADVKPILSVTLLKICDDPNVTFPALTEENIKDILANAGITETPVEPEQPTYTMVELKGTDVLIDGTVFDYTGEPIEPAITVNVGGTQLVEGKDYYVTYTNNVEPGTATVTIHGIATASQTLGYTGEVSIDYTINAPAEPEVPEETTKPTEPTKPGNGNNKPGQNKPTEPTKPDNSNKPGNSGNNKPGQNKPTESTKPDSSNKPGQSNSDKKATLNITFVNLLGRKVGTAALVKTGSANGCCVFSASEIGAQAPFGKLVMWFLPVVMFYGGSATIIVPVI